MRPVHPPAALGAMPNLEDLVLLPAQGFAMPIHQMVAVSRSSRYYSPISVNTIAHIASAGALPHSEGPDGSANRAGGLVRSRFAQGS